MLSKSLRGYYQALNGSDLVWKGAAMNDLVVHSLSRGVLVELDLDNPVVATDSDLYPVSVRRLTVYRYGKGSYERKVTLTDGAEVWAGLVRNEWIKARLEYMCGYADGLLADHNLIGDVK